MKKITMMRWLATFAIVLVQTVAVHAQTPTPYAVWCAGNTTLYFTYTSDVLTAGGTYNGQTITNVWSGTDVTNSGDYNTPQWNNTNPTTVVFDSSFQDVRPTSCYRWFYDFSNLQTITGIEYLNTSAVTTMRQMFQGCSSLPSIDLSHFDTRNVTSMWDMFKECSSLTTLDVSSFDTRNVTNMWAMFVFCNNLHNIIFGRYFNTSNVTTMQGMFAGCSSLTTIDLSTFNTSNVTDMYGMFGLCSGLTYLDISNFDTSNVTNMAMMFAGCSNLTTLDISNFDVTHVQYFQSEPEEEGDTSGFAPEDLGMFSQCSKLKTIYCKNDWSSTSAETSYMFYNCTDLVGENGTAFNSSIVNKAYARPDIAGTPGYFTIPLIAQVIWTEGNKTLTFVALPEEEMIAVGSTFNGQTVTSIWSGIEVIGTGEEATSETITVPGWNRDVQTVVFDSSFQNVRPKTCAGWFSECRDLTSIVGLENLNTSETLDMKYMFRFCTSLTSLDLHTFDTSNLIAMNQIVAGCSSLTNLNIEIDTSHITDMSGLFAFCSSLTSLDLHTFDTRSATNMLGMFSFCSSLTSLDLSNFDTSNVTEMGGMFAYCSSLTWLNLTGFDVSQVTSFHAEGTYFDQFISVGIFTGCSNLSTIFCNDVWSTASSVAPGYSDTLFDGCTSIVGGTGTTYDASNVGIAYARPDLGTSDNSGYFTAPLVAQVIWTPGNSTLTFLASPEDNALVVNGTYKNQTIAAVWSGTQVTNTGNSSPGWHLYDHDVVHVVFDESFQTIRPTSCYSWFEDFINVTEFTDLKYLNTTEVTNMSMMFYMVDYHSKFTSLDVSHFNTSKVTTMRSMFNGCDKVTALDVSNFNTSNVTNMRMMFASCNNLESINLSNFNTSKVTTMHKMFTECSKLTTINMSNFVTTSLEDMMGMFAGCTSLTSIDLSNFDTSHLTGMLCMFVGCSNLESINFGNNFDTSHVTNMLGMFAGCTKLNNLDLSMFNTSLVTDMSGMFSGCSSLTTLDLTNFNTSNVTNFHTNATSVEPDNSSSFDFSDYPSEAKGMFSACTSLTTIFCGDDWNTNEVQDSDYMFFYCTSLVGGYGTEYDASHMNVSYAHPDAEGNPGYFTLDTEVITGNKPGNKETYWTTYYYGPTNTYIANSDGQETTVYVATLEEVNGERVLTMTPIEDGVIKAGQGVVIESNQQSITMKHSTKKTATGNYDTNELKGFTFATDRPTNEGTIYTMGNVGGTLGFYKLKDTVTKLAARKAYLAIPQSSDAGFRFYFEDDEATGIVNILDSQMQDGIYYNLAGQHVKTPTKGIYIINGKKVYVK